MDRPTGGSKGLGSGEEFLEVAITDHQAWSLWRWHQLSSFGTKLPMLVLMFLTFGIQVIHSMISNLSTTWRMAVLNPKP